jgi:hypothetical protein
MLSYNVELGLEKHWADGAGSSCKLQARPLVREGAPYQQSRNWLKIIKQKNKNRSRVPDLWLTQRQTDRRS